jgi:excisionase family DNA binding protein
MAEAANSQAKTLTVEEAGRVYFGVGRVTSYKLAKAGRLPIIKIGRLLRVSVPALERVLEEVRLGKGDAA